jgi:hypothetical protein
VEYGLLEISLKNQQREPRMNLFWYNRMDLSNHGRSYLSILSKGDRY